MVCMYEEIKRREEGVKREAVELLRRQVGVEDELVRLYAEVSEEMRSSAARHLLHMIQLDSAKHIDVCSLVIEVLEGEDVLEEEKEETLRGLQRHIELEKESIDLAKKMLDNAWIRETEGLKTLIERWKRDEEEHHAALRKIAGKTFFRISDPFATVFKTQEELEERYKKYERKKKEKEEETET